MRVDIPVVASCLRRTIGIALTIGITLLRAISDLVRGVEGVCGLPAWSSAPPPLVLEGLLPHYARCCLPQHRVIA